MELGFKGKTALVTGASEGIGMAIARKLAEDVNITGATQQAIPLHPPGSACNAAIRMFSKELSMVVAGSKSVVI